MRIRSSSPRAVRQIARLALVAVAVAGLVASVGSSYTARMNADPTYEAFLATVRSGVVASVPSSAERPDTTTTAALDFVAGRSGATLDEHAREELRRLESECAKRGDHTQSVDELGGRLTDWLLDDVLATLEPSDVDATIEASKGFDAPDLPASFKRGRTEVRLAIAEPEIILTPIQARQAIESLQASTDARDTFRLEIASRVTARVAERVGYLNAADATRFRPDALTPVEAFLVTYSAISNDLLAGTASDLKTRMRELESAIDRGAPAKYPSPTGRLPYGTNGYLASSPLDGLFSRSSALFARFE